MNILLIEDERATARQIKAMVEEVILGAHIVCTCEGVQESIDWLNSNPIPDIILSDIELADGISFDIFKEINITVPVIFITAYNAYMQRAFKVNSIDYLLKPLDKEELRAAFSKHQLLISQRGSSNVNEALQTLINSIGKTTPSYKSRFLVRSGDRLSTIPVEDVAFLRADDKIVFLHTNSNKKYIVDDSLDALEQIMDPDQFFRLNRRYISPLTSIEKINTHFNGKLKITLSGSDDQDIFVSREKAAAFKQWLNK